MYILSESERATNSRRRPFFLDKAYLPERALKREIERVGLLFSLSSVIEERGKKKVNKSIEEST